MKPLPQIALLSFILLSACQTNAFEGQIIYHQNIISKHPTIDEATYLGIFGDTVEWYFSKGSSFERSNGSGNLGIYTTHDSLIAITLLPDTAIIASLIVEPRNLDSLYFSGNRKTILGHDCRELVKIIDGVKHIYWVAHKLNALPADFHGHQKDFMQEQYALAKAHHLAYTYESAIFKIERIAVQIIPGKLNKSQLLPPDSVLAKWSTLR